MILSFLVSTTLSLGIIICCSIVFNSAQCRTKFFSDSLGLALQKTLTIRPSLSYRLAPGCRLIMNDKKEIRLLKSSRSLELSFKGRI